jgi:hypothetical protein
VLTITLAATAFRAHHWGAALGALIGGAASIGWMAVVNFVINSDFKWLLLGMALLSYLPPRGPRLCAAACWLSCMFFPTARSRRRMILGKLVRVARAPI